MPLPQPEDWADRIRALEREVKDLKSSITNQGGVTTASQGLIFPNQATPAAPPDGGHLHGLGGEPYWRNGSGDIALIQDFPRGVAVSDPNSISAGVAPADYSQSHSAALRNDIATVRTALVSLLQSLRGSDIISPS